MGSSLNKNPLSKASELVCELGLKAEILAGEQVEAALACESEEDFQYWSMVAKAIALLTRQPADASIPKTEPIGRLRPAEKPVLIPRRASS